MKKTKKSKAKAKVKSTSAKKPAAKKIIHKKAKAKKVLKVKSKKTAKAKPVAKKIKAKAKIVVKASPKVSKTKLVKAKPVLKTVTKKAEPHKVMEAPKKVVVPPAKPAIPIPPHKMPYQKEDRRKIIRPQRKEDPNKTRYSDVELEEFRAIIKNKLEAAKKELTTLQAQLTSSNDHGTDDTANTFKMLEDGSDSLAKEEAGQLASRQRKFIDQLEHALVRIENKTYGICRVTGKLIPKERLRAVPHTTQSIEAKLNQYRD